MSDWVFIILICTLGFWALVRLIDARIENFLEVQVRSFTVDLDENGRVVSSEEADPEGD